MEEDKYRTLESLRETKKFLNGIKGYLKEDEESVELDTLATIALLRRPELAKRGDEALGDKYGDINFTDYIYGRVNSTLNSNLIVRHTMEMEALIRCVEAHNKGMNSNYIYKKYLGFENSEDSHDNLYLNKRLDVVQKQFVAMHYDVAFKENTFSLMVGDEFLKTAQVVVKKTVK